MKTFKYTITLIAIILFVLSISWWSECVVYKTWVGKWYYQSELVNDSAFYSEQYLQINDSIRIVKKESVTGDSEFVVQVIETTEGESLTGKQIKYSSYVNTKIYTYSDTHNGSKWDILRALQSRYENPTSMNTTNTFFN